MDPERHLYLAPEPPVAAKFLLVFYRVALLLVVCSITAVATSQSSRRAGQKPSPQRLIELAKKAESDGDLLRSEWKEESLLKAIKKYKEAQTYCDTANDSRCEAEILKRLGDVHIVLSYYDTAVDYYNQALQLSRKLADEYLEVDLLNRISKAYLETANINKAVPHCRRAQEISRRVGYERGTAEALNYLGLISSLSGDVMQAQDSFNQALAIWRHVNYDDGLAYTLLHLGYLHGNLGNTQLSLDFYQRALALCQSINDTQKQALTLTAIGGAYTLAGEKQQALNFHTQALKLFRTMGNRTGEAATLNGIGYIYDLLGEKNNALRHYLKALQQYKALANRTSAAITLGYVGRVYSALGDKEKALQFYNEKLTSSRVLQDRRMEAYTLKDLGNVLSFLNRRDQALDCYQQALTLSRSVMDRRGEAHILESIGGVYEHLGQTSQALHYYQQSLSLMQAVTDRRGEILTLYSLARTERNLGRLTEARTHIEKSLKLIESLRTKVVSPALRISYVSTVYQHYEFYIDLLMRLDRQNPGAGYNLLALEVNEHARAKTLLENLSAARLNIRRGVDAELLAKEDQLQQRLNQKAEQQMRLLSGKGNPQQAMALKEEIEVLLAQFEEVKAAVREESPLYAALTQPRQFRLAELQKELDQESLLVEFSLGTDRSYAWAVTDNSVSSVELPGRSKIEAAAIQLYELLAAKEGRPDAAARYSEAATRLSNMLFGPIAPLPGRKRVVIVADGILQYIPFSALPEPDQAKQDPASWQPLIVNHEIINLPSLSTLAVLRREVSQRSKAPKALAVFADPVFEKDDPRVGSARNNNSRLPRSGSLRDGSVNEQQPARLIQELESDDESVKIERLPFTYQEAQAIFKVAPEAETKRAIGFDANLKVVLDPELRQYRIVHFATHALLNSAYPELSGIVLSLVDKLGHPQAGFLRLNEIYNLDLPAELVVLSACRTGLGKAARGEGLIGLTRGFMYSGVPRVVASLWRIDDRAAAELMSFFYEAMFTQHLTPAAALRAAQIKMWQTNKWQFPHYWAAFVLQGEWK